MSAFNDPRYLAAQGLLNTPRTIEQDKPCPKCGYNLKGLTVGGVCPECGRAISVPQKRMLEDTLVDAPRAYLLRFTVAISAAFVGLACIIFGLFTALTLAVMNSVFGFYGQSGPNAIVGPQLQIPTPSDTFYTLVFLFGSLAWVGGFVVTTLPRPDPPDADEPRRREWYRLRVASWGTQGAWVLAAALLLVLTMSAPTPGPGAGMPLWVVVIATISAISALVAFVGLVPSAVLLSCYADWVPDTELSWRMRTSAWSIGVFGALIVVTGLTPPGWPSFAGVIPFMLWLGIAVFWVGFLGGLGVQFFSIGQLAMAGWAAKENHRIREERDQRMLEKMRREKEEYDQRIDAVRRHVDEPAPGVRKVGVAPRGPDAHPTPRPKP
ncbi:MAG: hypothetical protein KF684_09790 [Phycisphaeraceae bacterium]|nr:hypothetical protein [Phycisphaeraceae bacterium]